MHNNSTPPPSKKKPKKKKQQNRNLNFSDTYFRIHLKMCRKLTQYINNSFFKSIHLG